VTVSIALVRELAVLRPGAHVLSVYVRTDPRDLANTAATPGWLVELRNRLRELPDEEPRDRRLSLRELRERVEREVLALQPRERARGLAWFLTSDGTLDRRFVLQLPPRSTLVRWDDRPFVSPLIDVVDRGRPTGLMLVGAEAVRLLHWRDGRVEEPEHSLYELERRNWRDYDAYVGHRGRSAGGMHVATFDQRVGEWRQQFLNDAAAATAEQLTALGWDRVVVAGERRIADGFSHQLPEPVRSRVIATVETNLLWEEPAAAALRLEHVMDEAWRREADLLVERAVQVAPEGGAALGWADVLASLVQHRVEHLVFAVDAHPDPALLAPHVREALGEPAVDLLVERAVEHAVTSAAAVTTVPHDIPVLRQAGGAVATLRY